MPSTSLLTQPDEITPFELVYDGMARMLQAHPTIATMVKPDNFLRFDREGSDPTRSNVMPADLPEMQLWPEGPAPSIGSTSDSSSFARQYAVMVATGDQRVDRRVHKIEWAIFEAAHEWTEYLAPLEWRGTRFVIGFDSAPIDFGLAAPEQNRNIRGWSAVWRFTVRMEFAIRLFHRED